MEKLKDLFNSSNALMVHAEKIVTIAPKQRPVVITSLSVSIILAENLVSNLARSVPELECSKRPNLSQATAMLRTSTFAQEENVQPTSSIVQMLRPVKLDFSNVQISLVLRMFSSVFWKFVPQDCTLVGTADAFLIHQNAQPEVLVLKVTPQSAPTEPVSRILKNATSTCHAQLIWDIDVLLESADVIRVNAQ
jgi:hypothetical protein